MYTEYIQHKNADSMKYSCYFLIINTAFLHKLLWNHFIIDSFCLFP
ncbi:hypothetical protein HMPREF9443_01357 [Phascolarctobacterium succinatutens YIT 12067]|uniref:Uncharacterized protein n=1 Tax=Phascolarctobacterium succinatutens YIT 12067 TaxID=626939 RepID=E8LES3_9FIRM|nr:hypothetical protein HMPREF9443_01357 [Phascolarctobacterium succinatutens YIT 12067]